MKLLSSLVTAALLLGAAGPLSAQLVVRPEAQLTPEQLAVRGVLYDLRDSLQAVDAAVAHIARDRVSASDPAMRSRARVLADRCRGASAQLDSARTTVTAWNQPDPDPKRRLPQYLKALDQLQERLGWCNQEFTRLTGREQAEELRGYGIGRGERVREAILRYDPDVRAYFAAALNSRYEPSLKGAGRSPGPEVPR